MCDNDKWLGVVCQIDKENRDVQIKFMHLPLPACSFEWATREDVCWVPDINAILVVDTPVPSTQSGRRYRLSTSDLTNIERVPIEQFLIIQFNSKLKINSILPFSITLKFKHNVFVF